MKKNWIPVALFISIAFVVFVVEYTPKKLPTPLSSSEKAQQFPTFFISGIETLQFDDSGKLAHKFEASEAQHFQANLNKPSPKDFTAIQNPRFYFYKADATPWHLSAEQGRATENGEKLELSTNVNAWQSLEDGETRITAPSISLYPNRQLAESDKTVIIRYPRAVYSGLGMEVDFKQQVFTLLSKVKGKHEPPTHGELLQSTPTMPGQPNEAVTPSQSPETE
ncbi:LPS export ABC transporter periplasmic protein LptC [Aurantivibrio plasticivorans]